ncbi:MAG: dihydroorotase [Spirochaetales bacterium]|nr:dihydroorotase [Spirochaetales bacterium]
MIDPHVHFRDWNQKHKETVKHGLQTALSAGLDGVFEMPNTDPPIITLDAVKKRMALSEKLGLPVFHGIYGGLTKNRDQVREIIEAYHDFFPRVVGLKLYAGETTGNLAITEKDDQEEVIRILKDLGYEGVLAVHCEDVHRFHPRLWNENKPYTHALSRPPESEVEGVRTILNIGVDTGFRGTLHICHVSVPETVELVNRFRVNSDLKVSCGVTPHHLLLQASLMKGPQGYLYKVNPPLREKKQADRLFSLLFDGKIDWIESDHAPHTLSEKKRASGLPVIPIYPFLCTLLKRKGMSDDILEELTHNAVERVFQITIPKKNKPLTGDFFKDYGYNPFIYLTEKE